MIKRFSLPFIAILLLSLIAFARPRPNESVNFVKRNGTKLALSQSREEVKLRGISFSNDVYSNERIPKSHSEKDYKRVAGMGMNCIRFYMNYITFEEDEKPYVYKKEGYKWIDKNIAWAKKNNIFLILNMHFPQGGFQSNSKGGALWDDQENAKRLTALWKDIAKHYATEPTIAGYDLVNEPIVTRSLDQWKDLAQQITDEIRQVDTNHLIIVERVNAINRNWENTKDYNFVKVNDENTMYTFHFYSPIEYTHQNTDWTGMGDGGHYPDTTTIETLPDTKWMNATFANPLLPAGTTGWQYYEGVKFQVNDPRILLGKPAFGSSRNSGEAYFDDFIIKEYDMNGVFVRDIQKIDPETDSGWWFWSKNSVGTKELTNQFHSGEGSISISRTTDEANISCNKYRFRVTQGYYYSISGWMKGDDIPKRAKVQMRIDFETIGTGEKITYRNKSYLEQELTKYLTWTKENNLPVFVGEFGLYRDCFNSEKGGLNWVKDILDLLNKHEMNYCYHTYHEDAFGLYYGHGQLPDPVKSRKELIKLFTEELKGKQ